MWQEFILVVALAPCAAMAFLWLMWVVIIIADNARLYVRARIFRRHILCSAPLATMNGDQLAQRIWEADWLLKHARTTQQLRRPQLEKHFSDLIAQYRLEELSREAYELWQKSTLDGHFPMGLMTRD